MVALEQGKAMGTIKQRPQQIHRQGGAARCRRYTTCTMSAHVQAVTTDKQWWCSWWSCSMLAKEWLLASSYCWVITITLLTILTLLLLANFCCVCTIYPSKLVVSVGDADRDLCCPHCPVCGWRQS